MKAFAIKHYSVRFLHNIICILLALLFVISAVMTGTYAWNNYGNHKTNEMSGTPNHIRIALQKLEKNQNGEYTATVVEGAQFHLYRQVGENPDTSADERIGGVYVTDKEGHIFVHDLKSSKTPYYFLEVNPSYGYVYDSENGQDITKYFFYITGTETEELITVKAYNRRLYKELAISKIVKNADSSALTQQQKEQKFEFIVTFSDGGTYPYSISGAAQGTVESGGTITLSHGQTAIISDLPVGVSYTVTEKDSSGYIVSGSGHQGHITIDGSIAEFVNTLYENKGSLIITKEVTGINADEDLEFSFLITFEDSGEYPYFINGKESGVTKDGKAEIKLSHGDKATFPALPAGIKYTVTETDADTSGYTASVKEYTGTTVDGEISLPFVNHTDNPGFVRGKGNLKISKAVSGEGADKDKAFSFTVSFADGGTYEYRIGNGAWQPHVSGSKITLKAGETAEFKDIPESEIYTVIEDDYTNDGYVASVQTATGKIVKDSMVSLSFDNYKIPESKLIVKKIVPNEVSEWDKDKVFDFTVTINGKSESFGLKNGEEKIFPLPDGAVYEVQESDYVANGYILSTEKRVYTDENGVVIHEVICTNTFTGTVQVKISGTKTWDMTADPDRNMPESITVYLMDGERIVDRQTVVAPDWKYSFTAPKYRDDGKTEIKYTVKEEKVEGFESVVDGINIKNIAKPPSDTVKVNKIWLGEDNNRPESITVQLYKNGTVYGEPITLNVSNNWSHIWENLPKGEKWEVDEINVPVGYEKRITGDSNTGFIIYNSYNAPDDATVLIKGTKTWNHGKNLVSSRPKKLTLKLYADGKLFTSFDISESTGWRYALELPKHNNEGNEIVYTVDEIAIKDYRKAINGYDITNTHISVPIDPSNPGGPQTGDSFHMIFWLSVMIISAGGLWFTLRLKHRNRYKGKYAQ